MNRGSCGFTLIEILIVMIILGVLATSVALALPDPVAERQREYVDSLLAQAETAALRAATEAVPWGWEVGTDGARLWKYSGAQWSRADDRAGLFHAPPPGMKIDRVEVDGMRRATDSRIVFADTPPIFEIHIVGSQRQWRLSGRPNGSILLEEVP